MDTSAARYDRWKAPAEDGQVLLWPPADRLLADTRDNHQHLSAAEGLRIQNVPVAEVRRRMRQWLGHDDESRPIIATGHQAELHHPGVWVKDVLIGTVAQKLGGRALHFAVDTDEPKHLQLRWPGGSFPLTDDAAHAKSEWSGLMNPPTPEHLHLVEREFHKAAKHWTFESLVPGFLADLRHHVVQAEMPAPQQASLPAALMRSAHALDRSLGLTYESLLVSPICLAEPYLLFVHHVLSRAELFASDYNAVLDGYRRDNKIRAPGRPMPNLKLTADACEVPFWLDSLADGSRARATVVRDGTAWGLRLPGGQHFRFTPVADGWDAASRLLTWMREHRVRLAPRALTLTAVLRLLVADQFVHGIGGGQYDQVLDRLIARHFTLDPPRFSVTTATLFFPEAVGQPRVCLPCLAQEGHRLRHGALGAQKREMVEQIAALPRRSPQRAALFYQMHDRLSAAWLLPQVREWEKRFREAEQRQQEERTLFDRELFYALQPAERLEQLITRYRGEFC